MRTIKDIDISRKRVFIRADFNVPLDSKQQITDDARIEAVLPTLKYALSRDACVILASHLGRPKGQVTMEFSLQPVARRLGEILGLEVMMAPDCIGEDVAALAGGLEGGQILLLENLRFHKEEQQNDSDFGKALAAICDVYINDAFAPVSLAFHPSPARTPAPVTPIFSTSKARLVCPCPGLVRGSTH